VDLQVNAAEPKRVEHTRIVLVWRLILSQCSENKWRQTTKQSTFLGNKRVMEGNQLENFGSELNSKWS